MTIQYTKALIVVHREESADDFREIALRIKKLDPTICGAMAPEYISEEMLPAHFLALPLLVVYLVNPPASNTDQGVIRNATNLAVESINKIEEYEHFKKHKIPCLPIERFKWGMELDPAIYGDWVVLKPENIQSTGEDINMVPTELIPKLMLSHFPEKHLIRKDDYLVQKFVRTGKQPISYRVCVFLDQVIYSRRSTMTINVPSLNNSISELLSHSVATNNQPNRIMEFHIDDEVNMLAIKVAKSLRNYPIFGIDIIRDENTGELFALETNPGGNVWHFSSQMARDRGLTELDRQQRISQYNAWDVAAEALVSKTHQLAS